MAFQWCFTTILPFMEQNNYFLSIQAGTPNRALGIKTFQCPGRGRNPSNGTSLPGGPISDYAFNLSGFNSANSDPQNWVTITLPSISGLNGTARTRSTSVRSPSTQTIIMVPRTGTNASSKAMAAAQPFSRQRLPFHERARWGVTTRTISVPPFDAVCPFVQCATVMCICSPYTMSVPEATMQRYVGALNYKKHDDIRSSQRFRRHLFIVWIHGPRGRLAWAASLPFRLLPSKASFHFVGSQISCQKEFTGTTTMYLFLLAGGLYPGVPSGRLPQLHLPELLTRSVQPRQSSLRSGGRTTLV